MNLFAKLLARTRKPKASGPGTSDQHAYDTRHITATIDRALSSAGMDRHTGPAQGIRTTIDQALARAGLAHASSSQHSPVVMDRRAPAVALDGSAPHPVQRARGSYAAEPQSPATAGDFVNRSFTNDAGTRAYKLYLPHDYAVGSSTPLPLVVMLHGCTQSPDDFAAGTRMNQFADTYGFLVAYPAQEPRDNGSKCWNWFRSTDQVHGRGEPSLIAGIARQVASDHRIDPRRIFVAGLSAGAAMAVILGETYPDVFAAVGAHSGLPFAAAHDVASAFTAMKGGSKRGVKPSSKLDRARPVATIVFHGDADHTVAPGNGLAIVRDAANTSGGVALHATRQHDAVPGGRAYSKEVFVDPAGHPRVEHWLVHGAGHAWSGGSVLGSYTDPAGPDASAEMIRFFLQRSGDTH